MITCLGFTLACFSISRLSYVCPVLSIDAVPAPVYESAIDAKGLTCVAHSRHLLRVLYLSLAAAAATGTANPRQEPRRRQAGRALPHRPVPGTRSRYGLPLRAGGQRIRRRHSPTTPVCHAHLVRATSNDGWLVAAAQRSGPRWK